jgi:uncharacterized protein YegP (UPF0339 family)
MPVEFFKDEDGEHRFRIKGRNGRKMMVSEGYGRPGKAVRGYNALQKEMLRLAKEEDRKNYM